MVNFLYNILLMSISGTLMYLVSLLFCGRKRYVWLRYAALIAAILLMLIPVEAVFRLPKMVSVPLPERVFISGGYTAAPGVAAAPRITVSVIGISFIVWLTGAAAAFISFTLKYRKSARIMRQITSECRSVAAISVFSRVADRLNIRMNIELRTSDSLRSPMLFGILRPMVIIPAADFTERELEMMITHELTHYRHRDLCFAMLAALAKCIHWFNPAVYMADRAMITARELCCDEVVLERLEPDSKKEYGDLLLSVIETTAGSGLTFTTSMASSKVSIQRRLIKIIEHRTRSRLFKFGCFAVVASFAASSVTAFGFELAKSAIPEDILHELEQPISLSDTADALFSTLIPAASDAYDYEPIMEATAETEETADAEEPEDDAPEVTKPEKAYTPPAPEVSEPDMYEITAEAPEIYLFGDTEPEYIPVPESYTINLASSAYMFKPEFTESEAVRSDNFEVPAGVSVSILKYTSPGSDLRLEIYDADTDELVTGETEANTRSRISFMMNIDRTYYIIAYCTTGGCDGIYVSGRDMYR